MESERERVRIKHKSSSGRGRPSTGTTHTHTHTTIVGRTIVIKTYIYKKAHADDGIITIIIIIINVTREGGHLSRVTELARTDDDIVVVCVCARARVRVPSLLNHQPFSHARPHTHTHTHSPSPVRSVPACNSSNARARRSKRPRPKKRRLRNDRRRTILSKTIGYPRSITRAPPSPVYRESGAEKKNRSFDDCVILLLHAPVRMRMYVYYVCACVCRPSASVLLHFAPLETDRCARAKHVYGEPAARLCHYTYHIYIYIYMCRDLLQLCARPRRPPRCGDEEGANG